MSDIAACLPSARGIYALDLKLPHPTRCTVGALGTWTFPTGHYVYVGSAWGPGGLRARVGRHLRGTQRPRWHIDYVRTYATPIALWLAPDVREECAWAAHLSQHQGARIIAPRFGASDCRCAAHLFYFATEDVPTLDLPYAPEMLRLSTKPPIVRAEAHGKT